MECPELDGSRRRPPEQSPIVDCHGVSEQRRPTISELPFCCTTGLCMFLSPPTPDKETCHLARMIRSGVSIDQSNQSNQTLTADARPAGPVFQFQSQRRRSVWQLFLSPLLPDLYGLAFVLRWQKASSVGYRTGAKRNHATQTNEL